MPHRLYIILAAFILCLLPTSADAQLETYDQSAAVVMAYHRIGEDQFPDSNVRLEQFEAHVQELTSGNYNVISLPEAINAIETEQTLPENAVVLTFDGGHKSVMRNAIPILDKHDLPYTLFIPTGHADRTSNEYLDWDDVRSLAKNSNVTIGLHPAAYVRLYAEPEKEMLRQINNARATYREHMSEEALYFAYPFGEYDSLYRNAIQQSGFKAAFGQQSGVAHKGSSLLELPRFPMTESYSGLDRFRLIANAKPLPVTDIEPKDPLLTNPNPTIGFTINTDLTERLDKLSCFVSGQPKPEIEIVSESRIELRLTKPFEGQKERINCTLPITIPGDQFEEPRWRWFGMQFILPKDMKHSWQQETDDSNDG